MKPLTRKKPVFNALFFMTFSAYIFFYIFTKKTFFLKCLTTCRNCATRTRSYLKKKKLFFFEL